eukprot:COSAG01_NODE_26_length_36857_cov_31.426166_4_plen_78_part_00
MRISKMSVVGAVRSVSVCDARAATARTVRLELDVQGLARTCSSTEQIVDLFVVNLKEGCRHSECPAFAAEGWNFRVQ